MKIKIIVLLVCFSAFASIGFAKDDKFFDASGKEMKVSRIQ